MRSTPLILALTAALLSGCASVSKDLEQPRDPLRVVRDILTQRLNASGVLTVEAKVLELDAEHIRYEGEDGVRGMRFEDIALVERELPNDFEIQREDLRVYFEAGTASVSSASAVSGGLGFGKPFVLFKARPLGSTARLRSALARLAAERPAPPPESVAGPTSSSAPVEAAAEAAPLPSPASEPAPSPAPAPSQAEPAPAEAASLEARLRQLKAWHAEGLITQEEYDAKRKELLAGY